MPELRHDHERANDRYYRIAIGSLQRKPEPIKNPTKRAITFIYTTWDRFVVAKEIADLYSTSDEYVERLQYRLKKMGFYSDRTWSAQYRKDPFAPALRLKCHDGETLTVRLMKEEASKVNKMDEDAALKVILERIKSKDGPLTLSIPIIY